MFFQLGTINNVYIKLMNYDVVYPDIYEAGMMSGWNPIYDPSKSWMNAFENDMVFWNARDPSPLGEYCLMCVLITILTIGGGGFKDFHLSLWEMIQLNSIICVLNHIYIVYIYIYLYMFIYYTSNGLRKEHQVNIQILHFLLENLLFLSLPVILPLPQRESFGRQAQW